MTHDADLERTARCAACSRPTRSSRPPGSRCSPTPCATRPCRSPRRSGSRRWPAPRPTSPGSWPTRAAPRPTPLALRADDDRRGRCSSTCVPASEALRPRARAPSCTPARRWSGSAPRARCGARSSARCSSRASPTPPRRPRQRLAAGDGSTSSRATTAARSARWPASSARRCGSTRCATTCTATTSWCSLNEGLGKVLRYGAYGPEVIDRLHWMTARARPDPAAGRARSTGPDRRQGDHRPDAPDGRRGPQPQPRRLADAAARAAARR